jgi:hypothetical protein
MPDQPGRLGMAQLAARVAGMTRATVIASVSLAIVVGLWPMQPGLLICFAGILVTAFLGARWWPATMTAIVLAFSYTSFGVAHLIGGFDIAGQPFFLAGFVGLVLGLAPWNHWQARAPWRVPLAWWATGVAVTWPYFAWRDLNGSLASGAALQMCLAIWMDRWLAERPDPEPAEESPRRIVGVPLLASALVTSVAALYQYWVDLTWLSLEPWPRLGRAVGLMGDANPMGVATALWAPLAWATLGRAGSVAGLVAALLLWSAAWASGARTTLILILAGVVALLTLASLRLRRFRLLAPATIVAVLVLAMAIVSQVTLDRAANSPIARLRATVTAVSVPDAAYELLWRRDGYGLAAAAAIGEHPWFGVGIGKFFALSTGYHQRVAGRAIPPDNAQNLWRQTLVEQGIVGLLPVLWLTCLALASLIGRPAADIDVVLRVMLLGFGAALLVGYPLQDSGIAVTFATLVCTVVAGTTDRRQASTGVQS